MREGETVPVGILGNLAPVPFGRFVVRVVDWPRSTPAGTLGPLSFEGVNQIRLSYIPQSISILKHYHISHQIMRYSLLTEDNFVVGHGL